jgi:hypothetical protein
MFLLVNCGMQHLHHLAPAIQGVSLCKAYAESCLQRLTSSFKVLGACQSQL